MNGESRKDGGVGMNQQCKTCLGEVRLLRAVSPVLPTNRMRALNSSLPIMSHRPKLLASVPIFRKQEL